MREWLEEDSKTEGVYLLQAAPPGEKRSREPQVGSSVLTPAGWHGSNSTFPTARPGYGEQTGKERRASVSAGTPCRPEVLAPGGAQLPTGPLPRGPRGGQGCTHHVLLQLKPPLSPLLVFFYTAVQVCKF